MTATRINVSSLPGPEDIARRRLPNGAMALAYENFSSPSVVVHGWMWVGSIDVPPHQAGLAAFTASMLTRGTERRTFAQIGEEIESLGASISISSSGHTTAFTAKCLVEDLSQVLDVLTDCLYHPTFPSEYVEKRRGEVLTAIEQREHDTQAMALINLYALMYPDHPYGRSQLGYRETIATMTRDDVERFYKRCYGARGMGITIVGAIERERGLDVLEEMMGNWQGADYVQSPLPSVPEIVATREKRHVISGKTQTDIMLGWVGPRRTDPDFYAAYLANCVLGQFGMMGRIGDHVRDEQGLAYYAYTSLEAGIGPGPWSAVAGVAPANVDRAIASILREVQRMRDEPVGDEELADNKAYLIGSLPLRLEGNEGIAAHIANMELYGLGTDYLRRLPALIESVTAEDIMAVVNKYMNPRAYVLSVAGPPAGEEG